MSFFSKEVEDLDKEYHSLLHSDDLDAEAREEMKHLCWVTLEDPDEIWCEAQESGDRRYTLIADYNMDGRTVWCVAVCLLLRGEVSFLFISFVTRRPEMVDHYRKGDRVSLDEMKARRKNVKKLTQKKSKIPERKVSEVEEQTSKEASEDLIDGLAEDFTADEFLRADLMRFRQATDIPPEDFELYEGCMEATLESPDELWLLTTEALLESMEKKESEDDDDGDRDEVVDEGFPPVMCFLKRFFQQEESGNLVVGMEEEDRKNQVGNDVWYLVFAREIDGEEDEVEVIDAFPTRDASLINRFRVESDSADLDGPEPQDRIVH